MADKSANDWRATLKKRLTVAFCVLLAWAVAIEARLVYLQVFSYADLSARADRQQSRTIPSPAKRGDILDRNGRILARTVSTRTRSTPFRPNSATPTRRRRLSAVRSRL